ncbi:MAG TPA: glycerol-3-phosphate dehydrogenase [Gemmatimonadales bacterium]|nr:glycerol-3-phosphate dehydrogenase [Gemmatimonadales bacterium]
MNVPSEPGAGPGQLGGDRDRGGAEFLGHRSSLETLGRGPWDLLVLGGGIVGAATARDAAMRGLRVALVERGDIGSGTSSHSSRLAHGGLRYLEHGDFRLVFEALHERGILRRIAPHLVHPLPFVFPVYRGDRVPLWKLLAGMWLYDLLAGTRNVRAHRMLGKRALLRAEPMLRERGLVGGARYWDCQVDDARLTLVTARSALAHGAAIATYTAAESLLRADGRVAGARVHDLLTGERGEIHAPVVVNATGPWSDAIRRLEDPAAPLALRLTKGVHVQVPRARLGHTDAVTLTSAVDGRVMFVLPWGEWSYIGTTDTDFDGTPDRIPVTDEDVTYLLRSANAAFPHAHLTEEDVVVTWAGVRPLVRNDADLTTAQVSREHSILRGSGGMLSIVGGKLTTHRRMAAQLVDRVVQELRRLDGRPRPARAPTDVEPLPGGEAADLAPFRAAAIDSGVSAETADHLVARYGTEAQAVLNLVLGDRRLAERLHPAHPAIAAQVVHAARRELARTLDDVLTRRIHLRLETADGGAAAAALGARLLGEVWGWDPGRVAREAEAYVSAAVVR